MTSHELLEKEFNAFNFLEKNYGFTCELQKNVAMYSSDMYTFKLEEMRYGDRPQWTWILNQNQIAQDPNSALLFFLDDYEDQLKHARNYLISDGLSEYQLDPVDVLAQVYINNPWVFLTCKWTYDDLFISAQKMREIWFDEYITGKFETDMGLLDAGKEAEKIFLSLKNDPIVSKGCHQKLARWKAEAEEKIKALRSGVHG